MHAIDFVEFYITNVCNLNCTQCNRFNNFAFRGHSRWADHSDTYQEWANRVNPASISILGGEPLGNPDFLNWMHGIANLWPSAQICITSNGTQLDRWPTLYNELCRYNGRVHLLISEHTPENWENNLHKIKTFLQGDLNFEEHANWKKSYNAIKDQTWPDCDVPDDFYKLPSSIQQECRDVFGIAPEYAAFSVQIPGRHFFKDSNGVTVLLEPAWEFKPNALIHNNDQIELYNSDPEQAIKVCSMKKCPQFSKGKLYKCPPVTVLAEFTQQFSINVCESDQLLINAYEPAMHNWPDEKLKKFLDDLKDEKTIPQCKFCPESLPFSKFSAGTKKIKLVRR